MLSSILPRSCASERIFKWAGGVSLLPCGEVLLPVPGTLALHLPQLCMPPRPRPHPAGLQPARSGRHGFPQQLRHAAVLQRHAGAVRGKGLQVAGLGSVPAWHDMQGMHAWPCCFFNQQAFALLLCIAGTSLLSSGRAHPPTPPVTPPPPPIRSFFLSPPTQKTRVSGPAGLHQRLRRNGVRMPMCSSRGCRTDVQLKGLPDYHPLRSFSLGVAGSLPSPAHPAGGPSSTVFLDDAILIEKYLVCACSHARCCGGNGFACRRRRRRLYCCCRRCRRNARTVLVNFVCNPCWQDEYKGSHWIDYETFSTRGSISVHINANRCGGGSRAAAALPPGTACTAAAAALVPNACHACMHGTVATGASGVLHHLAWGTTNCRPSFATLSCREGNGKRFDHWIDYAVGW